MNRTSILLTALLILILSSVAVAQEEDETSDVLEVCLQGGWGLPMGGLSDWQTGLTDPDKVVDRAPKTGWDLGIDIGYFLTPKINIGVNFTYTEFAIDVEDNGGHHHRLFNPGLYGKYYFEGETDLVPYLKATVGLQNAKFSTFVENPSGRRFRELSYDPVLSYGVGVGLLYYTADYSGIFIEANYFAASSASTEATYQGATYTFGESIGGLQVNFGVRLLVGSGD